MKIAVVAANGKAGKLIVEEAERTGSPEAHVRERISVVGK